MDRAHEGNETRQLALDLGFIPVVPPLRSGVEPWEYDRETYKRRDGVSRATVASARASRNSTCCSSASSASS